MAQLEFSITGIFEKTFGIGRGKPFDPSKADQPGIREELPFEDLPTSADDEGTEFVNMRNSISANNPITGAPFFMPIRIGGVLLPNEPSIIITPSKNILKTPLVGSKRRGTVKELIAVQDYDIVIRGIAINYQSKLVYPEDQVKSLHDLFLRDEALSIECAITNLMGIYRIVIEKGPILPEMMGVQHCQAYEFQCISDEDFILELD